ncbi:Extracellular ligand-binding receptor [[Actinomadura] parvosata subsp. kistnae]|uniref:Branched-chain amino acid ABC transporter substrate-binding protein n=1 Tax=[Actinomadura] parvosata subsp. kistnae TaxID=1909395 RepID=A0A1U9ZQY7_9ACTN|nr:amino acid ABC transporter substrate-binding protein [Nonomuraea sp. ATCC 55076]AQZ60371.1 branched-chain amino acid ABC transporter substrate-binding protein [Nonomuraea sp. ATCC 55076]SPL91109.1 Extracellular ligand-binding receptor [Actinomadura parvosata subsp. kistnae]
MARVRKGLTIISICALALTACAKTDEPGAAQPPGQQRGPVRIGISLPLTGDFSEPGKGIQEGYQVWADRVNAKGGLLGRKVELIFRDDASDPNRVSSDYESLITQDKVDLVFGPFSSRLVIPAAKVAESYGMLFVEPAGAAAEVFEQGFKRLFYAAPAIASDHYNYLADYLTKLPPGKRPKTAAYASLDDPFAQGTAYGLRDKLAAAGVKTVVDEVYPPETTDFAPIAAKIAAAKPDVVVGGTQFEDSVGLVRALQELKVQPKLAAFSTGPTLAEFPAAVKGAAEHILSPVGWSATATFTGNQELVKRYKELFGGDANEDAANGYTVGQIVEAAVTAVKCVDPTKECQDKLAQHIGQATFDTVVGPLSFDDKGRPEQAHMIQQYVDGKIEIVLPEQAKTADLVYPKRPW